MRCQLGNKEIIQGLEWSDVKFVKEKGERYERR